MRNVVGMVNGEAIRGGAGSDGGSGQGVPPVCGGAGGGRPGAPFRQPACSALTLRASADEREYLDRFQALLAIHHVVNPTSTVPRRDGLMGVLAARLRDWIWRQVQYSRRPHRIPAREWHQ